MIEFEITLKDYTDDHFQHLLYLVLSPNLSHSDSRNNRTYLVTIVKLGIEIKQP
jgi:hypothetical protein